MKRKLFPILALLSLVLFAGTVWWWMHSSSRIDELTYERPGVQTVHLWGTAGKLTITSTADSGARSNQASHQLTWGSTTPDPKAIASLPATSSLGLMPFAFDRLPASKTGGSVARLVIPAWMLAAVFALPPALWIAPKFKRKKKPAKE